MPVTNDGLGWDSLLKMVHNPACDWHPGAENSSKISSFTSLKGDAGGCFPTDGDGKESGKRTSFSAW